MWNAVGHDQIINVYRGVCDRNQQANCCVLWIVCLCATKQKWPADDKICGKMAPLPAQ